MIANTKYNKQVEIRQLTTADFDKLSAYLNALQPETVKRFGPHGFDRQSIAELYQSPETYKGFVALDIETAEIVAYAVVKIGYLLHDANRLQACGITPHPETDCTYAPSVADAWQSQGIGNILFAYILEKLKPFGIQRVILWGGVQRDNQRAVNYYLKNGFRITGEFEYNGSNFDMIAELSSGNTTS